MVDVAIVVALLTVVVAEIIHGARRRYPLSPHPVLAWWRIERVGRQPTRRDTALASRIAAAHAEARVVPVSANVGRHSVEFTMSDRKHWYYFCGDTWGYRRAIESTTYPPERTFPGPPPRELWRAFRRAEPVDL